MGKKVTQQLYTKSRNILVTQEEMGIENPRVGGSNPPPGTRFLVEVNAFWVFPRCPDAALLRVSSAVYHFPIVIPARSVLALAGFCLGRRLTHHRQPAAAPSGLGAGLMPCAGSGRSADLLCPPEQSLEKLQDSMALVQVQAVVAAFLQIGQVRAVVREIALTNMRSLS